jgi:hypothetical protein
MSYPVSVKNILDLRKKENKIQIDKMCVLWQQYSSKNSVKTKSVHEFGVTKKV